MKRKNKKFLLCSLFVSAVLSLGLGLSVLQNTSTEIAQAASIESVLAEFTISEKAQVKTMEPNGIRFIVTVDEETRAKADALTNQKFGTILLPQNMLGENELTLGTANVLNIPADKWMPEGDTYTGVLAGKSNGDGTYQNLPESYYNRVIVARGYVTGTNANGDTVTYYTSNTAAKSMGYVAAMNVMTGASSSQLLKDITAKTNISLSLDDVTMSVQETNFDALVYNGYVSDSDSFANITLGGIDSPLKATYSVGNSAVAEVVDGRVVAKSVGSTTLTATYTYGDTTLTDSCTVTVSSGFKAASDYSILVPAGTTSANYAAPVTYAANDLQKLFKEATGVTLPIVEETGKETTEGKYIALGATKLSTANSVSVTSKKDTATKVLPVDSTLFVRGNTDEGTMYGAYELMRELFGYEYFAKDTYAIDAVTEEIELPTEAEYVPDIEYSISPSDDISTNDNLLNRYRMNNWYSDIMPVNGGRIHNTFDILPPFSNMESSSTAGNFADHQNWYTTKTSGWYGTVKYTFKDDYDRSCPYELCFNANGNASDYTAMLNMAVKAYTDALTADKTLTKASLSIRDNVIWCSCSACKAETATDAALGFLNDVCAQIRSWLQTNGDPRVDTFRMIFLAYYTTGAVPTAVTTLDPYIDVWFAESFAVYTRPLNDASAAGETAEAWTNLQAWANLLNQSQNCTNGVRNNNLLVWTYNSNMYELLAPYDSFDSMRTNYGLFADLNVNSVYNYTDSAMSGWASLKKYLASKLAWNAKPTDVEWNAWIDEFFASAYGDGAAAMKNWFNDYLAYADTIESKFNVAHNVSTDPVTASIYQNVATYDMGSGEEINTSFFTEAELNEWLNFATEAISALDKNDPNYPLYYNNILLEQLSPMYLLLEIYGSELDGMVYQNYANAVVAGLQGLGFRSVSLTEKVDVAIEKYTQSAQVSVALDLSVDGGMALDATKVFGEAKTITSVINGTEEVYVNGEVNITTPGVYIVSVSASDGSCILAELHVASKVIRTAADFSAVKYTGTNIEGYYVLDGDIDASGAIISGASYAWSQNSGFKGTFDGRGYTVRNLTVGPYGIFGTLGSATVKNVNFENAILQANSSLLAWTMYKSTIENVNVTYAAIDTTAPDWRGAGLLVARQTATESKWINVTLEAAGLTVPVALGYDLNSISYDNVMIKALAVTVIGYSDNGQTQITDWPTGVTFIEKQASIINVADEYIAEAGAVTLQHELFTLGSYVTVNGVEYMVETEGKLSVTVDGLTVGAANTVACILDETKVNFTNVFAVTQIINDFSELSAVQPLTTTTLIEGYYILGNNIDGDGTLLTSTVQIWNQNYGFRGTFDGRGHTISNFNTGNYGIFGNLGYGAVVKNVTLNVNKSFSNVLAYAVRSAKITDVTVTVGAVQSTDWYEFATEINDSTVTNLSITYAESVILGNAWALCKSYSKTTFTKVSVTTNIQNAEKITNSGTPDGVTVTTLGKLPAVEETIATEVLAEVSGATFTHASFTAGETVTATVNGTSVTATAYDGYVTVGDLSAAGMTVGNGGYTAVITTDDYLLTYSNVFYATQIINELSELSVVQALATDVAIYGYYVLGNDINGNGATLASTVQIYNQNYGFRGTFDGRGHTISNFNTGNYGIFGNLAYGAVVKNVTLDINKSYSNAIAYAVRATKITDVTVNIGAIVYTGWYEFATEINNSTVTNLSITYAESVILDSAWALCKSYTDSTFTNVSITTNVQNAEKITNSGTPSGVTVSTIGEMPKTEETIETEVLAEVSNAVFEHASFTAGENVTMTVNGADVTATAYDGYVTADVSGAGMTVGNSGYTAVITTDDYVLTYTNVFAVTQIIDEFSELSVLAYTGNNAIITGYYVLGGNIDGAGAGSTGGATSCDQNAYGFKGTFDGRNYTISNFKAQGYGIFGAVGSGAVIKNVNISCSATCVVLANALRYATVQDVNITVSKLDWAWSASTAFQVVGSTLKNVTINASEVTNSSHILCQTYNSEATFTNVSINVASADIVITTSTPATPSGVTVTYAVTQVTETIETKLAADAATGLILSNSNIKSGDSVAVTVNGNTVNATATANGAITVDVSGAGLTAGTVYTVVLENSAYKLTCTDVIYADKVIRTVADLAAVKYTGTNITGYFAVAGNIAATTWVDGALNSEAEISGASQGTSQNAGFQGTFDGRGYTISGLAIIGHGIFGGIGKATVKDVSFTGIQLGWDGNGYVLAYGIYNSQITNVYIQVTGVYKGRAGATWVGTMCHNMQVYTRLTNVTVDVTGASLAWALAYNASLNSVANSYSNVIVYTNNTAKVIGDSSNGTQSESLPSGITVNPA